MKKQFEITSKKYDNLLFEKYKLNHLLEINLNDDDEEKYLNELNRIKEEFDQKKIIYLKEIQEKQTLSINNLISKTEQEIYELRSNALDSILKLKNDQKLIKDSYESLREILNNGIENNKENCEYKGKILSLSDLTLTLENFMNTYINISHQIEEISINEAQNELIIYNKNNTDLEIKSKQISDWTNEIYTSLLQSQSKLNTLKIQNSILNENPENINNILNEELNKIKENNNKSEKLMNQIINLLQDINLELGGKKTDSLENLLLEIQEKFWKKD